METEEGTVAPEITSSTEGVVEGGAPGPDATAGGTPASQPTGINPAWEPLREAIGEDFFNAHAMPVLKGMDESAHTRITNLNAQLKRYEPYQSFVQQGVSPADLQMAMELRQLVESNPQGFYEMLGNHLGLTSQQVEDLNQFGAGQENPAEIPPEIMARLEQAEQFQQNFMAQMQQAEQAQQHQRLVELEGQRLDSEMSDFLAKNPTFTEDDKAELFRIQYELTMNLQNQGMNRMATLEEAAKVLNDRFSTLRQRWGVSGAPSVLPTTTGGNIPGQQPNVAKMSKNELADLVAGDLLAAKAHQS